MFSVQRNLLSLKSDLPTVATLGNFDGIHVGHQSLLRAVADCSEFESERCRKMMISFYPHPALVLKKAQILLRLSDLHDEKRILQRFGIEIIQLIRFTPALSDLSAREFIERILLDKLNVAKLFIGPDARVGRGGEGTAEMIVELMAKAGRSAEILPFSKLKGKRVSSRLIRDALTEGMVSEAHEMLGRPYSLRGRVVHGAGRGNKLGIPTANLATLGRNRQLPARGVYACWVAVDNKRYPAVANIGTRPTFGSQRKLVLEAHILDFPLRSIYGSVIEISFLSHIREEKQFGSKEELLGQISQDIAAARNTLSALPHNGKI